MELLEKAAFHTVLIYCYLILLLRTIGRRELGQLTAPDFLVLVLLGSAVETSMVLSSTLVRVGLVSAATLMIANRVIALAVRNSKIVRRFLNGGPVLVVHDGVIVQRNLRRLGLSEDEVMQALRGREQANVANVRYAVFEPNGEITVVPKSAQRHTTNLNEALTHCGENPISKSKPSKRRT